MLDSMGPELAPVHLMAGQMLCGGKRMRPAFCVWGYVAAAGMTDDFELKPLLAAAASLDVLHVSALVHDDVMDSSDLRRGRPAAHRQFEALHANAGWLGDSAAFGKAGAILLGDLLVMWSAQMLQAAGLEQSALERALPIVEAMRTEVTCGQYLDMVAQAHPLRQRAPAIGSLRPTSSSPWTTPAGWWSTRPRATRCNGRARWAPHWVVATMSCTLRSARMVHRSVAPSSSAMTCSGSSATLRLTGKPAGDDLREGKRTVLVAHSYAHASDAGQKLLLQRLGDPGLDETGISRAAAGDHRVGCPGRGGIDDQ